MKKIRTLRGAGEAYAVGSEDRHPVAYEIDVWSRNGLLDGSGFIQIDVKAANQLFEARKVLLETAAGNHVEILLTRMNLMAGPVEIQTSGPIPEA